MEERIPILVTGAHRSGTTWVGKMLTASKQVAYISEPLNVWHRPGVFSAPTKFWYTYICNENEEQYLPAMQETIRFDYHTRDELKSLRSIKDVMRMVRDWRNFGRARKRNLRPLLKDPFAVFSVPWFNQSLNCQTIVVVRHPAAFVSSLKRLDWEFNFNDLLKQPFLMRDWLDPFRAEMEAIQETPQDIIRKSSLLWKMIYAVVATYRDSQPGIQVVRHEDMSTDPLGGFRSLYEILDLELTLQAEETIIAYSSPNNPAELSPRSIHGTRVDSRANIANWKHRLTVEEITKIRQLIGEVADLYYTEQDWV